MLVQYQERQAEFRRWSGGSAKLSGVAAASALADRDLRIAELESQVALLTASRVAIFHTREGKFQSALACRRTGRGQ